MSETSHSRNSLIEDVTQLLCMVEARREPISLKVSKVGGVSRRWESHRTIWQARADHVRGTVVNQSLMMV